MEGQGLEEAAGQALPKGVGQESQSRQEGVGEGGTCAGLGVCLKLGQSLSSILGPGVLRDCWGAGDMVRGFQGSRLLDIPSPVEGRVLTTHSQAQRLLHSGVCVSGLCPPQPSQAQPYLTAAWELVVGTGSDKKGHRFLSSLSSMMSWQGVGGGQISRGQAAGTLDLVAKPGPIGVEGLGRLLTE